jgi:WD40 repeat protein
VAYNSKPPAVECFNAASGAPLYKVAPDVKYVHYLEFSADGTKILCLPGYADRGVIMECATNKEVHRLVADQDRLWYVVAAPDGRYVVVTRDGDKGRYIDLVLDAELRKELGRIPSQPNPAFALSADGKTIAVANFYGAISQWDISTGKMRAASADPEKVHVIRFLDKGKNLLTFTDRLVLVDWKTGSPVRRIEAGPLPTALASTALSADGKWVATAEAKKGIALTDAHSGKELRRLDVAFETSTGLQFTPDSRKLVFADKDTIFVWDVADGAPPQQLLQGKAHGLRTLVSSADGQRIAVGVQETAAVRIDSVVIWDLATGRMLHRLGLKRQNLGAIAFSPNGDELAFTDVDFANRRAELHQVDTRTGQERRSAGISSSVESLAYTPDGRSLAIAELFGLIRLRDRASGQDRFVYTGHRTKAHGLAFSPDGALLAAASNDAPAFVWDVYGKRTTEPLTEKAFAAAWNRLWDDLGDKDTGAAFQAIRRLVQNSAPALTLLRANLAPAKPVDQTPLPQWLRDLDSEDFGVRQTASAELEKLADRIETVLQKAMEGKVSLETRRRIEAMLARAETSPDRLRQSRALEALEQIATPDAVLLLKTLVRGEPAARLTREAAETLDRIRKR